MAEQQFDDNGNPVDEDPQWLKDLRRKGREFDGLEKKLQSYEQRDSVRGVEELKGLSDRQVQALLATSGESTPDAWKQTAEELGFYTPAPAIDPKVQQGHEEVAATSQGAVIQPSLAKGEDPYASATSEADVLRIAREREAAAFG